MPNGERTIRIEVVDDKDCACPKCGAYWGHPDKNLDFPNRAKVENRGVWWFKCYNPKCDVEYYDPETGTVSD